MEYIQFTPSANHILLQSVESTDKFKINKKSEGLTSESKLGRVLKVGEARDNDFGVYHEAPCKEGDLVLFVSEINQNILTIDFVDYPVARYSHILGVMKEDKE